MSERKGRYDYSAKPVKLHEVLHSLKNRKKTTLYLMNLFIILYPPVVTVNVQFY